MKTAMQQLKERLFDSEIISRPLTLEEIDNYLEIEKKHIKFAWMEGKQDDTFGDNVFDDSEKFYNETFKID